MLETFLMDVPPVVEGQIEALMEGELGDGFPLIPPTRAAVNRMIGALADPRAASICVSRSAAACGSSRQTVRPIIIANPIIARTCGSRSCW